MTIHYQYTDVMNQYEAPDLVEQNDSVNDYNTRFLLKADLNAYRKLRIMAIEDEFQKYKLIDTAAVNSKLNYMKPKAIPPTTMENKSKRIARGGKKILRWK